MCLFNIGQYICLFAAHGDFSYEMLFQLTESISMQASCQAFAAVSYLTIGDAESSSKV